MASTPTTKSQVQAYRFVLKRMESALVRRDAVMLHDPMRTHLRAAIVGLCLALVAVAGVFIFGFFKPKQALGTTDGIVMGSESGSVFVLVNNPTQRLIPAFNLASARLILVKMGGGGSAAAGAAAPTPRKVKDDVLKNIPREPIAGIPGAPPDIPGANELVDPRWTLCDTTVQDQTLPEQARIKSPTIETTAVIGIDRPGRELAPNQALLFRSSTSEYFLVFDGKRAEVDVRDAAVRQAFGIADAPGGLMRDERRVSTGLLNSITEAPALVSPIKKLGARSTFPQLGGEPIGTVAEVIEVDNRRRYYVILDDGVQEVPKSLAQLIRYTASRDNEFLGVAPEDIANVPKVAELDTRGFPTEVPVVMTVAETRLACLNWSLEEGRQVSSITVANQLSLPDGQKPVKLAQYDGSDDRLDYMFLPTGRGAAVRGVVPDQPEGTGTIFLVTDNGTKFGVPAWNGAPAEELARAIGLSTIRQAPEAILRLLPIGPALDPDQAIRTFDSVPLPDGAGGTLPLPDQQVLQPAPVEEPVEEELNPFDPGIPVEGDG